MERRGGSGCGNQSTTHTFSECWSANARATAATNTAAAVNNKFSGELLRFSQKNSGQAVQFSPVDPGAGTFVSLNLK